MRGTYFIMKKLQVNFNLLNTTLDEKIMKCNKIYNHMKFQFAYKVQQARHDLLILVHTQSTMCANMQ